MAKQHPFQDFDKSKMVVTPRSGGGGGTETEVETEAETVTEDESEHEPDLENEETTEEPVKITKEAENTDEEKEESKEETETPTAKKETGDEEPETTTENVETPAYTIEDFRTDVTDYLSESTSGKIKDVKDIVAVMQENERLQAALQNKELEFPSERAKKLYEFALKSEGLELSAASQYLHVQQLDLKTMSPKEKHFEAFVLSRPDITREKAGQIFEARYAHQFGEMTDEDIVLKDEHDQKTRDAESKILSYQKEFEQAKSVQPGAQQQPDMKAIEASVDLALSEFGGVEARFGDTELDVVRFPLLPEEVSELRKVLVDPANLVQKVVDKCIVNGKFDWSLWTNQVHRIMNHEKYVERARDNGIQVGQVKLVQERKNSAPVKKTNGAPMTGKKTFAQTMKEAVAASNRN